MRRLWRLFLVQLHTWNHISSPESFEASRSHASCFAARWDRFALFDNLLGISLAQAMDIDMGLVETGKNISALDELSDAIINKP